MVILFPRKRFRQRIRFFIMTPVSPWVHRKLRRRETYDGNSAWFACIVGIPNQQTAGTFSGCRAPVHTIYAEYVHFADLNAPLNDDEHAQLERLLKYGPALASHAPQGKLLLVTRVTAPSLLVFESDRYRP